VTPLWRAVPELRLRHFSTTRTTPVQAARADCQATVSAWRRLSRDGYAGAGDAARGHQGRRVVAADFLQRSPPPGMTIMACPRDLRWCPRRAGSRPGKRAGRRGKGPAALSWEERQRKPTPRAATSVPTASQAHDVTIARPKVPGPCRSRASLRPQTDHSARKAARGDDLDRS
jgi:hypothetical protein